MGDTPLYTIIAGATVLVAIITVVLIRMKKNGHTNMALLSSLTEKHQHSRVGGVVLIFLENAEFVRAMDTLLRRHKYSEAARVASLIGIEDKAAELFLQGKDYEEAANRFMKLGKLSRAAEAFRVGNFWDKAAEMYLKLGKPVMAAHMLLESGEEARAMTILEQQASEYERLYVMALVWSKKGEYNKSAHAYFKAGHFQEAAQAFEQAGDYSRAAEAFLKSNNPAMAARAMETAGRPKEAVKLYEKAGLLGEAARAGSAKPITNSDVVRLANKGNLFEAGMEAFKQDDYPLTERLLRALKATDKGYHRSKLILGKICREDGRLEEAHSYLKDYLFYAPATTDTLSAMKFSLNFLEEIGDLETCMDGLKRLEEKKLLDNDLKDKLHQLEIRHVQNMMGNAVSLEVWVRKGSEPQVMSVNDRQIEKILGSRFIIDKKLRDSGAVTTFEATDKKEKIKCRIRVLHAWKMVVKPELKRIVDETGRANVLRHPNIIHGIEGGMMDKTPYIVTRAPVGNLLQEILAKEKGPVSIQNTLKIASGIAMGLDYAHKNGFIHKGLSPSCVYVSNTGDAQIDCFGIPDAKFDKQGPILWGDVMFLSPEARLGRAVTKSSDIYSYALLMINILMGKLSYKHEDSSVNVGQSLTELRKHRPDISLGILALLQMALSAEPGERPKTAQAIAREIINTLKHS